MLFSIEFIKAAVLVFLVVFVSQYIYTRIFSRCSLPEDIPWVGSEGNNFFSRARGTLRSVFSTREMVLDGYNKYSKKDLPFVLPNITTGPEVILPLSHMDWLLQQPDNVLNQNEVNRQFLQAEWTMLHPKIIQDTVHIDVIRKEMTKMLGESTADVIDEIDFAFKKHWGVNTEEWTEVTAYYTMLDVISRISNRVLVGFPLCRNEDYIENSRNFARGVVIEASIISLIPKILKPIFSPIITILDTKFHRKCLKHILPMLKQRVASPMDLDKKRNDYIQWSIDHSYANDKPNERSVDLIAKRLSIVQFAAIQSSAITLANLILDLSASPFVSTFLGTMRQEVVTELQAEDGQWTKASLSRMVTLDSTLRESMRMWGFVSRGILKEVVARDGVTLPSGLHLPHGTKVGIHAYPVHRDEDIYVGASQFNPFRFCATDGEERPSDDYSEKSVSGGKNKGTSLVTTNSKFMAFSHGRHACPGRFFAAQQLKLVLAYIALHYDIQSIPSRPDNNWFVGSQGPPLDTKISIRRRRGGTC